MQRGKQLRKRICKTWSKLQGHLLHTLLINKVILKIKCIKMIDLKLKPHIDSSYPNPRYCVFPLPAAHLGLAGERQGGEKRNSVGLDRGRRYIPGKPIWSYIFRVTEIFRKYGLVGKHFPNLDWIWGTYWNIFQVLLNIPMHFVQEYISRTVPGSIIPHCQSLVRYLHESDKDEGFARQL